jgi:glycosyltransferase involved in cell wall biosynthesis
MRLAFVVQRYGEGVIGGAENYCRQLAEQLARRGHDIHVFTTRATDERSWANTLPEGVTTQDGITIHRFSSLMRRVPFITGLCLRLFSWIAKRSRALGFEKSRRFIEFTASLERMFFIFQGPWSPSLVACLKKSEATFDGFIFVTYLFYPSVQGLSLVSKNRFLIPTAHDEMAFYLASVTKSLDEASAIFTLSSAESDLVAARSPKQKEKIHKLGYGIISDFDVKSLSGPVKQSVGDQPYLLFLGRISPGKGVEMLMQYFAEYRKHHGPSLVLVLAGVNQDIEIPQNQGVIYVGTVSESDKVSLIRGSLAVVNPSQHESLSMVVIEAISLGVPVLVNAVSPVLQDYADRYATVFSFGSCEEFVDALHKMQQDLRADNNGVFCNKLQQSARKISDEFSWDQVINRLENGMKMGVKS